MAFLLLAGTAGVRAQQCDVPQIGAQVFVEPGQTPEDIDGFFRLLHDNGMKVARIRMFGAHMYRGGEWDFSLYDEAFRAADKYGVRLFATLFPVTDELNDVGGFKFPRSKAHLREIDDYITAVVSHFRQYESLWTWVLQNEPGSGGTRVAMTDLAREVYDRWLADFPPEERGEGYLKADFTQEKFLTYYTTWYLNHIAQLVERLDPQRGRHINPHQILGTLPDYDFPAYSKFLTSVGASLHLSWHFGMFSQREYPLGVSLMSDIIRHNALGNPFWITELQGGRHRQRQCSLLSHGGAYGAVSLDGDRFRRRRGDLLVAQSAGGRHGGGGVGAARLPAQALGPYARSREGRIGIAASRRRVAGGEACACSGDAPL